MFFLGYESSPDASKVDEDEMQMDQAAAPLSYSQPDYNASTDEMNRGLDNHSESSLLPLTETSEDTNDFESGVAAMPRGEDANDFDSGVAAMPRGEPETAAMAPVYNDDFSSVASMDDSTSAVLSKPMVEDEIMQKTSLDKSFHQSSYGDFDDLTLPSQGEGSQFAAPMSQAPVEAGSLALPQTPNIYSSDATRRVSRETYTISTNEFQSNPVVTNETITRSQNNMEEGMEPIEVF